MGGPKTPNSSGTGNQRLGLQHPYWSPPALVSQSVRVTPVPASSAGLYNADCFDAMKTIHAPCSSRTTTGRVRSSGLDGHIGNSPDSEKTAGGPRLRSDAVHRVPGSSRQT